VAVSGSRPFAAQCGLWPLREIAFGSGPAYRGTDAGRLVVVRFFLINQYTVVFAGNSYPSDNNCGLCSLPYRLFISALNNPGITLFIIRLMMLFTFINIPANKTYTGMSFLFFIFFHGIMF